MLMARNTDEAGLVVRIREVRGVCSFIGGESPRPADDYVLRSPTVRDAGDGQRATVEEPSAKPDNRGRRRAGGEAPAWVRRDEAR